MRPIFQYQSCGQRYETTKNNFKKIVYYNNNFKLDKNIKFMNINLLYIKQGLQL